MSWQGRLLSAVAIVLFMAAPAAAMADNDPGIAIQPGSFSLNSTQPTPLHDSTTPLTQAGAHPDVNIAASFCYPTEQVPVIDTNDLRSCPRLSPNGGNFGSGNFSTDDLSGFTVKLPPGMLANPSATPRCAVSDFLVNSCAPQTQVGRASVLATGITAFEGTIPAQPIEIYNLQPEDDQPALLGSIVRPVAVCGASHFSIPSLIELRTSKDFGVDSVQTDLPLDLVQTTSLVGGPMCFNEQVTVLELRITLFGNAANGAPFMVNPTSCAMSTAGFEVTSEGDRDSDKGELDPLGDAEGEPVHDSATVPFAATGCDQVPFAPSVSMQATETDQAGAPGAQEVGLGFPDSESDPIHQAHLKQAEVELPEGVTLNPAAALDLEGCTRSEFGLGNDDPVACPVASKIGDVSVETPILDADLSTAALDPLGGRAFFGRPDGNGPPSATNVWRLFIVLEGSGLRIKLEGRVEIDPVTGQVTTVFKDDPVTAFDESLPQTPFTNFALTLRGGQQSILSNPRGCGSHQISAKLTPWSDDGSSTRAVTVTGDLDVSSCNDSEPFQPTVGASSSPSQAGAETKSHLEILRPNGHQIVRTLKLSLPAGAVGSLAAVPQCPLAQVQAGSCSPDSQVGSVKVEVGPGDAVLPVTGQLYLGEPAAAGDAASIGLVIPGKAGPIDLGNVVVVNRVKLRQSDGGIDVTAQVPTSLFGIPLPLKRIDIDVDRPGFFRNPTGCDVRELSASFDGDQGGTASATAATQATGCDALDFKPMLRLIATGKGQTGKNGHPGIKAIVTQPSGEANIASTRVLLPQILRPDTVQINKPGVLCRGEQLAASACPPQSLVGSATAHSPLLAAPLSGPVYFVQDVGKILPRLAIQLRGAVSLDLSAGNSIQGIRTVNTFEGVPDVPVTRFELNVNGGSTGILKNFNDLCGNPDHANSTFTAHSGKSVSFETPLEVESCGVAVSSKATVAGKRARMSRKGVVSIKVKCSGSDQACAGKLALTAGRRKLASKSFSIPAGESKTVKVKINRKRRKLVKKRRGLRVTATISGAGSAKKKITITR